MQLRFGLLMLSLVVGGCVTTPQKAPQAPAPAPTATKPAPVTPPVVKPQPAPKPVPESAPVTGSGPSIVAPLPQPEPEKPAPVTPASTLLSQVQSAINAGELDKAAALCERALRISPRDGQLWYQLALIRFRQHRVADATETAKRALSMTNDAALKLKINELLQQSGR